MRESGFSYPDPMAANDDPAFATEQPTETEIGVAVADVGCIRRVRVAEVWFAVETAYQRQAVQARHDELELIRQAIQVRLANAHTVLAAH
jgi:hypothetical protein